MKGEGGGGGEPEMFAQGGNSCFPALRWCNSGMKTPVPVLMYLSCPIFFQCIFHSAHMCKYCLKKKGKFNGYCNECWLSGSEKQEEKKKGNARESWEEQRRVCLDARVSLGFMRRNDLGGKHDYFFPFCFFLVHRGVVCYKKAGRSLDTHH